MVRVTILNTIEIDIGGNERFVFDLDDWPTEIDTGTACLNLEGTIQNKKWQLWTRETVIIQEK